MPVQIQQLDLPGTLLAAQRFQTMQDEGQALREYKQAQAGEMQQKSRERMVGIVTQAAKVAWNQVKDLPADQQQQRANELRDQMRPFLQQALGPDYKEDPGPVSLPHLRAIAEMNLGGDSSNPESFYGSPQYYIGNDKQVHVGQFSNRNNFQETKIPGRPLLPTESLNLGNGNQQVIEKFTGRPIRNQSGTGQYTPEGVHIPSPPISGGEPPPAITGLPYIDPNMSDADIAKAVRDAYATGGAPAGGNSPPGESTPAPAIGAPPMPGRPRDYTGEVRRAKADEVGAVENARLPAIERKSQIEAGQAGETERQKAIAGAQIDRTSGCGGCARSWVVRGVGH